MGGNPLKYSDPKGLFFWDVLDLGFFAQSLYEYSQCSSSDNAINLGLDAVGLLPGIPALGTLRRIDDAVDGAKRIAPAKRTSNQTVLGHYPDYVKISDQLGARRFEVPLAAWNKMSTLEQWTANRKFLDRMISKGNEIILGTLAGQARSGSIFIKELDYLNTHGYKLNSNGTRMLPPGG